MLFRLPTEHPSDHGNEPCDIARLVLVGRHSHDDLAAIEAVGGCLPVGVLAVSLRREGTLSEPCREENWYENEGEESRSAQLHRRCSLWPGTQGGAAIWWGDKMFVMISEPSETG